MSKRTYSIIGLMILLCLGAMGSVYFLEKTTEQRIRQTLQQHDITLAHVRYSFFDNSLELTDIRGPNTLIQGGSFHIANIMAHKLNPEAFSPQASGHPLVAEEVIFSDIHVEYATDEHSLKHSIQSIRALGWKQNLGKVFSLSTKDNLPEYVRALSDCYAKEIHLTQGLTLTTMGVLQGEDRIQSSIMKGLSPTSFASYEIKQARMRQSVDASTSLQVSADSLFLGASDLPSYEFTTFLLQQSLTQHPFTAEQEQRFANYLRAFFSTGFKPDLRLEGLEVAFTSADKEMPLFSTKALSFTAQYDASMANSLNFNLNIDDIQGSFALLDTPPQVQQVVKNMLGTLDIKAQSSVQGKIHSRENSSTLDLSLDLHNLGQAELQWRFILPVQKLSEVTQAPDTMNFIFEALSRMQWEALTFTIKDQGFLPRSLISVSKQMQLPLQEATPFALSSMEKEIQFVRHYMNEKNYAALQQCIQNPGKLEWKLLPSEPMPVFALAMLASTAPAELPLQSICTPGAPLFEEAQKLLP